MITTIDAVHHKLFLPRQPTDRRRYSVRSGQPTRQKEGRKNPPRQVSAKVIHQSHKNKIIDDQADSSIKKYLLCGLILSVFTCTLLPMVLVK